MAVIDVTERQVEATFQKEAANGSAQFDARTATESPIKLLLDRIVLPAVGVGTKCISTGMLSGSLFRCRSLQREFLPPCAHDDADGIHWRRHCPLDYRATFGSAIRGQLHSAGLERTV